MGADFIFSTIIVPIKKCNDKGLIKLKANMLNTLNKFIPKDFKNAEGIYEDWESVRGSERADFEKKEEGEVKKIVKKISKKEQEEKAKQAILNALEDERFDNIIKNMKENIDLVFNALTNFRRDVSWFNHKGDRIFITGGMSWGDTPTNACNIFEQFYTLPTKVLKAGGFA